MKGLKAFLQDDVINITVAMKVSRVPLDVTILSVRH